MHELGLTIRRVLVVIIVGIVALLYIWPTHHPVRERERRIKCMNNLREIGMGCAMYASDFGGWYPTVGGPNREGRPLASLALLCDKYVDNPKIFVCPSTTDNCADLRPGQSFSPHGQASAPGERRQCSYGYDDTRGRDTKSNIVIAGDAPPSDAQAGGKGKNSDNHFGDGQNVLMYGGNTVPWITNTINPKIPGDDIYSAADPKNPGVSDSYIHQ